jgi:hypothetical protein
VGSIPTCGALEVWQWTFGSRTVWLVDKSAGHPQFLSVLIGDLVATFLPIIVSHLLLLPNQMHLLLAEERKHPENIVQCVEKAMIKYIDCFYFIPCCGRISAKNKTISENSMY